MPNAIFVLSTGRCGTQWLAEALRQLCGEGASVAHEPLGDDYSDPDAVAEHLDGIDRILAERTYIECGHPLWRSLPAMLERFAGRAAVLHLVRHPVPTAFSWVTQSAYVPPLVTYLREKVLLSPFEDGVRFPQFRERWPSMTPYEKALYYWAEVNALGLDLEARAPWMRLRFEQLFRSATIARVASFAGIETPPDPPLPSGTVDDFHFLTEWWADPALITRHPEVITVARQLGYEPLDFDEARLRQRYTPGW